MARKWKKRNIISDYRICAPVTNAKRAKSSAIFCAIITTSTRRVDVAYALAETYHVPTPRDSKELQLGIAALRDLIREFPESRTGIKIELLHRLVAL